MHNLCVLVGFINGVVETTYYVATVGIAVTHVGSCLYILGHDVRSKVVVEYRNGTAICRVIGEFARLPVGRAGERRGDVHGGSSRHRVQENILKLP